MHYKAYKSIVSAKNDINLYRGCTHGCIYCDARSDCYQMDHAFTDIEVKEGALTQLEKELKAKRKKCMIGTGAMTDPYMHLEETEGLTRGALELFARYGFGVALQTKSARVLRDLDLLREINGRTKCVVQMTLTTADDNLCKILEPNVSPTSERGEALKILRDNGVPTVVWLCPILPFINDTADNINTLVKMCADAGVRGIINFGMGLTLRNGNREYFYDCLDKSFPKLKERYQKTYGYDYSLPSPNEPELLTIFYARCREYGIESDNGKIFAYLNELPLEKQLAQTSLFD